MRTQSKSCSVHQFTFALPRVTFWQLKSEPSFFQASLLCARADRPPARSCRGYRIDLFWSILAHPIIFWCPVWALSFLVFESPIAPSEWLWARLYRCAPSAAALATPWGRRFLDSCLPVSLQDLLATFPSKHVCLSRGKAASQVCSPEQVKSISASLSSTTGARASDWLVSEVYWSLSRCLTWVRSKHQLSRCPLELRRSLDLYWIVLGSTTSSSSGDSD